MRRMLGALLFCLAAALMLALLAGYGERWDPPMELAASFRLHIAVAAAFLALFARLAGHDLAAGLALILACGGAAGLGPVYGPAERRAEGREVLLIYANLYDGNTETGPLRAMLRAADADILITSETMRGVADGLGGLRSAYPYSLVTSGGGPMLRTAIWSRYPLREGRLYLDNTVAPTGASAVAELGGGLRLGLVGLHLSRPTEAERAAQIAALGPIAAGLPRPLVVAGDFNAAPWTGGVARTAALTGTRVVGGYRVTWKGSYVTPLGRLPEPWGHQIDQILISDGIGIDQISPLDVPGSDHKGLFVRLRIPES